MGYNPLRIPREHNKYHGYTVRGTPNWPMNVEAARCILNYTQSKIDTNGKGISLCSFNHGNLLQFGSSWGIYVKYQGRYFSILGKSTFGIRKNHEENNRAILLTKAPKRYHRSSHQTSSCICFCVIFGYFEYPCKPAPSNGCQMVPFKGVNSPSLSV